MYGIHVYLFRTLHIVEYHHCFNKTEQYLVVVFSISLHDLLFLPLLPSSSSLFSFSSHPPAFASHPSPHYHYRHHHHPFPFHIPAVVLLLFSFVVVVAAPPSPSSSSSSTPSSPPRPPHRPPPPLITPPPFFRFWCLLY